MVIMPGIVSLLTDAATEMIYPLIPVFVGALGSGALPASVIFGLIYSLTDRKLPGFGGTFAFGFGGLIAVVSIVLLSLKIREPRKNSS